MTTTPEIRCCTACATVYAASVCPNCFEWRFRSTPATTAEIAAALSGAKCDTCGSNNPTACGCTKQRDVISPEFLQAVAEEVRQGWSVEEIATNLGASVEEVEGAICGLAEAKYDAGRMSKWDVVIMLDHAADYIITICTERNDVWDEAYAEAQTILQKAADRARKTART